ncbi:MAG: transposase, partial [Elusimicrobia bacterium]|nr:transposase [Elusimicrobiota bacterium]
VLAEIGYHPESQTESFVTYKPSLLAGLLSGKISVQIDDTSSTIVGPNAYIKKLQKWLQNRGQRPIIDKLAVLIYHIVMPRLARVVGVGLPHHVTQRGNYRQEIFNNDSDRERYLIWVAEYTRKNNLSVLAYCLMANHVHFVVVPSREDSLARAFNSAHMRYSRYFNGKHKIAGHLWQGRFYSCVLDDRHLLAAARYTERNPVRAKLVPRAEAWKWSSAAAHCRGGDGDFDFDLGKLWDYTGTKQGDWREFIGGEDAAADISDIRTYTHTGRPLGNGKFVGELEREFGRRLRALSVGRPKLKK